MNRLETIKITPEKPIPLSINTKDILMPLYENIKFSSNKARNKFMDTMKRLESKAFIALFWV